MQLSSVQVRQLTVGALTIVENENGYSFTRFTPEQRESFRTTFEIWGERCDYTSGIRIDFHTDATAVEVTVGTAGKYEVLIDDLCAYFEELEADSAFRLELSGGAHRVTILLPYHSCGSIRSVLLEGETYVTPHTYRKKVAFYGDSITQGSTAVQGSQSYTWLLTRFFDLHSMNFGVGGIRFQPETVIDVGYDPEVVFVSLGTNNYGSGKPWDLLFENCPAYFDRLSAIYPNSRIICITPIWRANGDEPKPAGTIHTVRDYIHAEAQKRNFTIVDGFTLVPHRTEYFADQRLHPNDMGFTLYAQNLVKSIGQYL